MQKVCFSDKENLSTSSPTQKQGRELSSTEDFVVIPTIDLEIQLFVGKVMALYGSRLKLSKTLFMNRV
ncbi:hypothetical protein [Leptospira interrogans]|nr:hypothetical protein [Leptospira interrogans]